MPTKFIIPPTQASYRVRDGQAAISVQLEGGAARYRKDVQNPSYAVDCSWVFTDVDYQYFRAFYNTETAQGALPFLIDLLIEEDGLVEHEAYFVPTSVRLSMANPSAFSVSAQLDVSPTS